MTLARSGATERRCRSWRLALAGASLLALPAAAQVAGTISGVTKDASGAGLDGATITARGPALQRESLRVSSADGGAYRLAGLPAGLYELTAELSGFTTQVIQDVRVGVNARLTLDFELALSPVEESLVVTSSSPIIEVTRSELATRVEPAAIDNLPLKTRNVEDLVVLVPGVTPRPEAVRDQQFSIFGERPAATGYTYDGSDNNDPLDGGSFQRYAQDAILEFEVITTGYQAEFGRAQGGIVNVITRSGTDRLQARAFSLLRNDSWDSSNVAGQAPPELDREQWGGSLGGKIREDRAFYFVAGEVLDEQRGRNIDLSTVPVWVQDGLATVGGAEDFGAGPQLDGETFLAKLDYLPTETQRWSFSANSTHDDAGGEIPTGIAGALVLPSAARSQEQESLGFTLHQSTVLGASWLLASSARYLDGDTLANFDKSQRAEAILLLFASGFIQTGAQLPGGRSERKVDRFVLGQALTWLRRDHELKFGYDVIDTSLEGFNEISNDVEYSGYFLYPDATLRNRDLFERFGFEHAAARFFFLSANPDGTLDIDIDNTDVAVYAQDQWRLRDELTLDLGLRWDRASLFGDDGDNLGPRLGATWDLGGRHQTILKATAGLFYDQNALVAASGVPEKGGFFTRNGFDVALPRLGAVYTDSLIDLVITSGFPIGGGQRSPPENPLYRQFAEDLRNDPLHLYRLLGIGVTDPASPPLVTADNVEALSGRSPDEVVALLEATYPGTDWIFFDVSGGSVVGDRVLSFLPRGPLDTSRNLQVYGRDNVPSTRAFTLGVEHQITQNLSLGVTYVQRDTDDVLTQRIVNLFDVPPGDPRFGQTTDGGPRITEVGYDGVIEYQGITLSLWRPFKSRVGFMVSYTYSESDDNLLTGNVGSGFSNNNHPEYDFGTSNLSVPNVAVVSFTTVLPLHLRWSGIAFYRDGPAFSPRGIIDTDGDGLVDQRDLSQPRNGFRADDLWSLDLRLEKPFAFGNGHEISLMIDLFNATNEDNVANVNNVSGPGFGTPNSFLPGREVQLGMRYFFRGR